ncbi:DUF3794 and LysM peptidoglycan-binding domain-containing protein [Clostridium vincentii]|uniref:LysM domain protein n=1 Tax=Clostridium vincentii TaxID=52704 RepID=A0A2T0BH36_9CLOT|nr:SPOCS domain-containing protein [Clostridium vincentii]PRR83175.1 LysM domain protein [Clostridium vincentii]
MSKIDVVKENLQFQQLLRENSSTAILKEEYLIPDTHPDVEVILSVEARPIITNKEIIGDKVILEGRVEYNVLYIPREDNMIVNSVNYSEKFTNSLDLDEGEHKVVCEVECKVEHIDATIMNERKIAIQGVINLNWELYKTTEFDFVKDIEATEGIEILKRIESINRLAANKEVEFIGKSMLRIGMDKPQVSKILKCSLGLRKKEVKVAEDKIYLGCYCKLNILYLGDESKDIISMEDDVYLSKEEEIPGIFADMIPSISYEIKNSDISIEEDDLGEARIINTEFLVRAIVKVFSDENIDIIKDAYSPKFPIELVKNNYEIGVMLGTQASENIVKDSIYLKEANIKPEKIITASGNTIVTEKNISNDRITIEGIIKVNVIYKTSDDNIGFGHVEGDIPFTITLDMPGAKEGMKAIVKCLLEGIDANIEANTIAIKATLSISSKVFYEITKEFISDVIESEGEGQKKKASIIIYVMGKEDTLWGLAKKYNTTVNDLLKINNIENLDNVVEGEKLIIPGRAIF